MKWWQCVVCACVVVSCALVFACLRSSLLSLSLSLSLSLPHPPPSFSPLHLAAHWGNDTCACVCVCLSVCARVCVCVSVCVRFPNVRCTAVGSCFFLRFVTPAIVSPQAHNIVEGKLPINVQRGLVLVSKVQTSVCVCVCVCVCVHCCCSAASPFAFSSLPHNNTNADCDR